MAKIEEQNLEIESREENSAVILKIKGNLDVFSLQKIRERMEVMLNQTTRVVFDLTNLEYIDSAGIGFIIGTLKRLRSKDPDAKLVICGLNDYLSGIFKLINFSRIIPMAKGIKQAWKELDG